MNLRWIGQVNPLQVESCFVCKQVINAGVLFYRACGNQDSPDAEGYNVCAACRRKMPNPPQLKCALENL